MHPDEQAVRARVLAYCECLDAGDFDGVAALFAHGVFRSPAGTHLVGVDAVRRMYDAVIRYADGTPRTKHVLGTMLVDVDPDAGVATARCHFTVLQQTDDLALQPVLSGRYHDRLARIDGDWWFEERMVLPDLTGDLRRHMADRA